VVQQINGSGAPVQAAVISDGTRYYVSLTNRETGKPIGSGADGGLSVSGDTTGLTMAVTQNATNAVLTVDGLPIESQSNQITTAIPGVTLTVKAEQPVVADLVINRDSSKTGDNLQAFVDAYNAIMKSISGPLRPSPDGGPSGGRQLDGTTAIELQQRMYKLLSTKVVETGTVRTLADLGVKLQKDGTVLLDRTVLDGVISKDSASVDAIFSTASTGLKAQTTALSTLYTDTLDGRLIHRRTSLEKTIKDLTVSNDKLSRHVESFKLDLIRRFTQMESLMANYNTIGNFLASSPVFNPNQGSK
jgi:flagellar hook-associated protein 2